jgi:replicative DNA helicase|uniref:Replicative DNA helicase n=1 Tax=Halamphora coffeiformis TaxID=1487565 RepID=A0A516ZBN8_9STRA|nr:DNA replication helicase [Halamphora coffeaeformis]QDR25118.1 DNA replication helicase [Halamphora coffeaeformis]
MENSKFDNKHFFIKQQLPHNFLAEQMILSGLLISSDAVELTIQTLPIEAFYFKNHQEIYKAIIFLYQNKISIDILTLVTFLQDNGLLKQIGGIKVLIELMSQIPNLAYINEYLGLIKEKFLRRCLIKIGYETINAAYTTNCPLEQILIEYESKIFNLTTDNQSTKLFSSSELLNTIFLDLKEKSLNPKLLGLPSGFYALDSLTQGFQKSDLIILAGRPAMGKTALSLNIILNSMKQSKLPILFFSLEMSKEQIIYRLLSMETYINQIRLKNGTLSQSDWIKVTQVMKILSKLPLFIDDNANLTIDEIRSKIKTILFEQKQIGLVVIDYLQLMQISRNSPENRAQELSQITRLLKTIAREFNIPIIALSQLSRNVENRVDKKPILSDLRESGSIEQDADLVLMLYRNQIINNRDTDSVKRIDSETLELILAKHRNGPTGTVKLQFDSKRMRFSSFNI